MRDADGNMKAVKTKKVGRSHAPTPMAVASRLKSYKNQIREALGLPSGAFVELVDRDKVPGILGTPKDNKSIKRFFQPTDGQEERSQREEDTSEVEFLQVVQQPVTEMESAEEEMESVVEVESGNSQDRD